MDSARQCLNVPLGHHETTETVSAFAAELRQRLAARIAAAERKRAQRAQLRRQLKEARDAGLHQRHRQRFT